MLVTSPEALADVCRGLGAAGRFALDTEFIRDRTYHPHLAIVQVATDDLEAILDPDALGSLEPLTDLVADPAVETVVHSGEQDLAMLYDRSGQPPRNVFDTQVAAAFVGYGEQVGFGKLVEQVTGVRLAKTETLTDWTRRPLTEAQTQYALDDVRYLGRLRDHLGERLRELGRERWLLEELEPWEHHERWQTPPPEELYLRLAPRGLRGEQLGALRELAAWREREAMRLDRPRPWIVRDAALIEVARRLPRGPRDLRALRSLKPKEREQHGDDLLAAVARGRENPPPGHEPRGKGRGRPPAEVEPLSRLLETWVRTRAAGGEVAASLLANRDDLQAVAAGHLEGRLPDRRVLRGWRREFVGEDLVALLEGRRSLAIEPGTGTIRLEPRDDGAATEPT